MVIAGQHLKGDSTRRRDSRGMVKVNHVPIEPTTVEWEDHRLSLVLPDSVQADEDVTLWLSLMVDGMETNALPFHLVAPASRGSTRGS